MQARLVFFFFGASVAEDSPFVGAADVVRLRLRPFEIEETLMLSGVEGGLVEDVGDDACRS